MHVARESASDDEGVVRRWLLKSREEHIAARSNTRVHQFYASEAQRHMHVTSNISDATQCIRAYCRSAELSGCVERNDY